MRIPPPPTPENRGKPNPSGIAGELQPVRDSGGTPIQLARTDSQAAIAEGTRALMLHRGPLLLDQPYAEWTHAERRHIAERHRLLLEALADASEQLGDPFGARLYRTHS